MFYLETILPNLRGKKVSINSRIGIVGCDEYCIYNSCIFLIYACSVKMLQYDSLYVTMYVQLNAIYCTFRSYSMWPIFFISCLIQNSCLYIIFVAYINNVDEPDGEYSNKDKVNIICCLYVVLQMGTFIRRLVKMQFTYLELS